MSGDFGKKLREARERCGITLRQIAAATKISVSALEALEHDDISRLPGGIFSRAFVRSYAAEVGLDPEEMVQKFIAEFPHDSVIAGHLPSDRIEDIEALESDRQTASTFLHLIALSIPLAAAVLYFGTSGRLQSRRAVEPAAPARAAAIPSAIVADPKAAGTVGDVPATERTRSPAAAASTGGAIDGDSISPVSKQPALTVSLTAAQPCWLSATIDGQKPMERLLHIGEEQTVEVTRELALTAGDAAAIRMTINGTKAKPLGRAGEVVTARINLANFKSYLPSR